MVEECYKIVPELMAPSVHDVNSWPSHRVPAREKKEEKTVRNAGPNERRQETKPNERSGEEAADIKGGPKTQIGDSTKHIPFLPSTLIFS
jgi:hypothetical protein